MFFCFNYDFFAMLSSPIMSLEIKALPISGVKQIVPPSFSDTRGFFSETYNAEKLKKFGLAAPFVQDNFSFSKEMGTLRGLHYQTPPFEQAKLVSVLRGKIFDVVVDFRKGSPTFGVSLSVELCAAKREQLFVPVGFLHGFLTLEPNTEVMYKVSKHYSQTHDGGVRFDDPTLNIAWPTVCEDFILSPKDSRLPLFHEVSSPFEYQTT